MSNVIVVGVSGAQLLTVAAANTKLLTSLHNTTSQKTKGYPTCERVKIKHSLIDREPEPSSFATAIAESIYPNPIDRSRESIVNSSMFGAQAGRF